MGQQHQDLFSGLNSELAAEFPPNGILMQPCSGKKYVLTPKNAFLNTKTCFNTQKNPPRNAISVWQPNQSPCPGFCWHHRDWEEFVKAVAAEVGIGEANSHFLYKCGWFSSGEQVVGMAQRGGSSVTAFWGEKSVKNVILWWMSQGWCPDPTLGGLLFLQGHPREGM